MTEVGPILIHPHPLLRRPAEPVRDVGPALDALLDDMRTLARSRRALGLAAPQVGVSVRACIVDTSCGEDPDLVLELVNPVVRGEGRLVKSIEGCLSLPHQTAAVERYQRVVVTYRDRDGEPHRLRCGGMQARAIQHEVDHLDGILIIDRAAREERRTA